MLELLLEHGASPDDEHKGQSALTWAIARKNEYFGLLLVDAGATTHYRLTCTDGLKGARCGDSIRDYAKAQGLDTLAERLDSPRQTSRFPAGFDPTAHWGWDGITRGVVLVGRRIEALTCNQACAVAELCVVWKRKSGLGLIAAPDDNFSNEDAAEPLHGRLFVGVVIEFAGRASQQAQGCVGYETVDGSAIARAQQKLSKLDPAFWHEIQSLLDASKSTESETYETWLIATGPLATATCEFPGGRTITAHWESESSVRLPEFKGKAELSAWYD